MLTDAIFNEKIHKIILSKPGKENPDNYVRMEILRNEDKFQAAAHTKTQVFHSNHSLAGVREFAGGLLGTAFLQYTAWDGEYEYSARVSKKGKLLSSRKKSDVPPKTNFTPGSFNRQKNHIIREGAEIPALVDMGVFTKELKVAAPMWDKFHQINRFLELLADETGEDKISPGTTVNIVDFGCGKSYLTFLVYHYFEKMRNLRTNICGLDLKDDVVKKCADAAKKYGYNSLTFRQGDIGTQNAPPITGTHGIHEVYGIHEITGTAGIKEGTGWGAPGTFNIVISLHACDTATDNALYNAVKWQADLICAVPCCQHELRNQMQPATLKLFSEYGIIKERIASLATDTIRASLLDCHGYKAQIIEFTDPEHTAKNLLIRARRVAGNRAASTNSESFEFSESSNSPESGKHEEIRKVMREFAFEPTLARLLGI